MSYLCAIPGCGMVIPREMLMCRKHWRLVPTPIQNAVWHSYRNGATKAWLAAREAAIKAVTKGKP